MSIIHKWTEQEIQILTDNYPLQPQNKLLELLPNRTLNAIKIRAKILKLVKLRNSLATSNISLLLEDTPLAYYWIGFIMADGCFTGVNMDRLQLSLSVKDISHIENFAKLLNIKFSIRKQTKCKTNDFIKHRENMACAIVKDKYYIPLITKKFDFKKQKTYYPPQILSTNNEKLLMCMLAGIIDGDGYIQLKEKRVNRIRIGCHKNWQTFYELLDGKIFKKTNPIHISKNGLMQYGIFRKTNLKQLINCIHTYNLPLMKRKWTKIFNEYGYKLI